MWFDFGFVIELNIWLVLRLLFSVIFIWFICLVLPQLCNLRGKLLKSRQPLPDVIHQYLPAVPVVVPDIYVAVYIILFTFYYEALSWKLMYVWILVMLFRCVTCVSTSYPPPAIEQDFFGAHYEYSLDLMFSGHTSLYTVFASAVNTPVAWTLCIVGALLSAMSRQHYTADIQVGFLISRYVYQHYFPDC